MYFSKDAYKIINDFVYHAPLRFILIDVCEGLSYMLEVEDDDIEGLMFLGKILLYDVSNYEQSIICFSKVLNLQPMHYDAMYYRAMSKHHQKDLIGSLDDYTKAIELQPKLVRAYVGRAKSKNALGDLWGAIADCHLAIEADSTDHVPYRDCAWYLSEVGDNDESEKMYTKVIELLPEEGMVYHNRGAARVEWGNYLGAIEDFTKALQYDPEFIACYAKRGEAKAKMGDKEGALSDIMQAILLGFEYGGYELIKKYNLQQDDHIWDDNSGSGNIWDDNIRDDNIRGIPLNLNEHPLFNPDENI